MNKMKFFFLLLLLSVGGLNASSFDGCLKYLEGQKAIVDSISRLFLNEITENMKYDYNKGTPFAKDEFELLSQHGYCGVFLYYYSLIATETNTPPLLAIDFQEAKQATQKQIRMTFYYLKSQQKKE